MTPTRSIIGIDCATKPSNIGIALARKDDPNLVVLEAELASNLGNYRKYLARWIEKNKPVLLALDAPLGWPAPMQTALQGHRAGENLAVEPDDMFSRTTDRAIRMRNEKPSIRPLEVGANLIARTAHAALELLADLRRETKLAIPLAWSPLEIGEAAAIEVYPSATRRAHSVPPGGDPLRHLSSKLEFPETVPYPMSEHVRDAVLCALAGSDFLDDACPPPTDRALAEIEGWIWVAGRR